MTIPCCPVCRGCGLHPHDRDLERVDDMRLCPACDGKGEPRKDAQREYPKSLQLFNEGHLRRHAASH